MDRDACIPSSTAPHVPVPENSQPDLVDPVVDLEPPKTGSAQLDLRENPDTPKDDVADYTKQVRSFVAKLDGERALLDRGAMAGIEKTIATMDLQQMKFFLKLQDYFPRLSLNISIVSVILYPFLLTTLLAAADKLPEGEPIKICDLACGYSRVVPLIDFICNYELNKRPWSLIGFDVKSACIKYNQEQYELCKNVIFFEANALDIDALSDKIIESGVTSGFDVVLLLHPEIQGDGAEIFWLFVSCVAPYLLKDRPGVPGECFMTFYSHSECDRIVHLVQAAKDTFRDAQLELQTSLIDFLRNEVHLPELVTPFKHQLCISQAGGGMKKKGSLEYSYYATLQACLLIMRKQVPIISRVPIGSRVTIRGLTTSERYNGRSAEVLKHFPITMRYKVSLFGTERKILSVREANLEPFTLSSK